MAKGYRSYAVLLMGVWCVGLMIEETVGRKNVMIVGEGVGE